jgi:hypothetical protein
MKIRPISDFYPYCDICGEKITDEEFLVNGKYKYHHPRYRDCLEEVNTDTNAENQRMGDEHEYI